MQKTSRVRYVFCECIVQNLLLTHKNYYPPEKYDEKKIRHNLFLLWQTTCCLEILTFA